MNLIEARNLLREEIVQVTGCTEPASVAYAFMVARRNMAGRFDPHTFRAELQGSHEILRNASTAVVPFIRRRGLRTVVAAGLSSRSKEYNLFPGVDVRAAAALTRRRNWLIVRQAGKRGVYIKATLRMPDEAVAVTIEGRHNEITRVARNGRILFKSAVQPQAEIDLASIYRLAGKRDARLEQLARDFVVRQVRGRKAPALPDRVAELIQARMCGASTPIMTITGSGNHGIFLGIPYYALYQKQGDRILPAVVFSLLAEVHRTGKRKRISGDCGLATKAAPALAAGLAYAKGAGVRQIERLMNETFESMKTMTCHGALPSCGGKARKAMRVVLDKVNTVEELSS